jgi:hypothetical protein
VKRLEKKSILEALSDELQEMERVEKVNLAVVNTLNKLIDACYSTEGFWRDNQKIPIQSSFMLFHASRNVRIVLQKMKQRFVEAEGKHENPTVVHESLAVIPSLSELCATILSLTKQTPTKDIVDIISQKIGYLRDVAFANSLLPTPEEEMQELDKNRLKKRFTEFANTLQAMSV